MPVVSILALYLDVKCKSDLTSLTWYKSGLTGISQSNLHLGSPNTLLKLASHDPKLNGRILKLTYHSRVVTFNAIITRWVMASPPTEIVLIPNTIVGIRYLYNIVLDKIVKILQIWHSLSLITLENLLNVSMGFFVAYFPMEQDDRPKYYVVYGCNTFVDEEQHKILVVVVPNTVSDPWAMVIHSQHASVTSRILLIG